MSANEQTINFTAKRKLNRIVDQYGEFRKRMMIVVYTCYRDALRNNAGHAATQQLRALYVGILKILLKMRFFFYFLFSFHLA